MIMHDETGKTSAARLLLVLTMIFLSIIVCIDAAVAAFDVAAEAWVVIGSLVMGLLAWTAGPRIAQYVGPQIGGVAAGIGAAAQAAVERGKPQEWADGEDDGLA